MRVLLIGEYSGLHLNLMRGLQKAGVDVLFTSRGDGWKQIPSVNYLGSPKRSLIAKVSRVSAPIFHRGKLSNADVVQFVSVGTLHPWVMKFIGNRNKRKFCVAAGSDSLSVIQFIKQPYSPLHAELEANEYSLLAQLQPRLIRRNHQVLEWVDGIIATGLPYYYAYKDTGKLKALVPLPIDLEETTFRPNKVNDKVKVFHGISRSAFKGTPIILGALAKLQHTYPDRVKVETRERIPLSDYRRLLGGVNVIVDQAYSSGYGMNALYGLAQGKIVLSGNNPDLRSKFGFMHCPVVNIEPDQGQIFEQLERIVLQTDREIMEQGEQGRAFVEKYHESRKVAELYVSVWNTQ